MLAVNAFLLTLIGVFILVAAIYLLLGRPLFQRVDKVCESIDAEREARAIQERLEKEEEARLRVEAEREIDEQFPRMKGASE